MNEIIGSDRLERAEIMHDEPQPCHRRLHAFFTLVGQPSSESQDSFVYS
jgi:hypothetical protein